VFRPPGVIVLEREREPTVVDVQYRLEAYATLRRRDFAWDTGRRVCRMISILRAAVRRAKYHRLPACSSHQPASFLCAGHPESSSSSKNANQPSSTFDTGWKPMLLYAVAFRLGIRGDASAGGFPYTPNTIPTPKSAFLSYLCFLLFKKIFAPFC
jgi:hypothetical protein